MRSAMWREKMASTEAASTDDTASGLGVQSYLPGSASLVEDLDKRVLVVLRDGRTLIGYLRSLDQFANLLLQDTIERIHVGKEYGDIPRGLFIVRGENVVLMGEVDPERESMSPLKCVSVEQILEAQQTEVEEEKRKKDVKRQMAIKTDDDLFV